VSSIPIRPAPPVTNARVAAALLALADAEAPGARPATELRSAAATLRQLPDELHGRRVHLGSLPHVSPRAADVIASFLSCGSDESVGDRLSALLDRDDPAGERKREFLSRADVDRVLAAPDGVSLADLRGDIHLHTDRSDGKIPLADLHRALSSRGDSYALLTDHARDCAVAGGLHAGDFAAQGRELDRLNARTDGEFAMLLGAEANIAGDGTIDVTPSSVPVLAAVVASVHTDLRSRKDQTSRLVRAIETPGVAVLGHPKGRLYNMRTGVKVAWDRVFAAAAGQGVAIEINGCPERQDLPPSLARTALAAGCLFALSSDAHAHRHLDFQRFALAIARLAGVPAGRVVNTWPRDRFEEWLRERRQG
jgi:histidinol phosphatase-like PHP family hydrolase